MNVIDREVRKHNIRLLGFYVGADSRDMAGHIIRRVKNKYGDITILAGGSEAYSEVDSIGGKSKLQECPLH